MATKKQPLRVAFEVEDLTKAEAEEFADLLCLTADAWCQRSGHELHRAFVNRNDLECWDDTDVEIRFDGISKIGKP